MPEFSAACVRDARAPAWAREWIAHRFGDSLSEETLGVMQIIVSELVTNAVQHAEGEIELTVTVAAGRARVAVSDGSPDCAPVRIRTDEPPLVGGRGLRLVEGYSRRWGCVRDGDRKVVWAEVDAPRR